VSQNKLLLFLNIYLKKYFTLEAHKVSPAKIAQLFFDYQPHD